LEKGKTEESTHREKWAQRLARKTFFHFPLSIFHLEQLRAIRIFE